MRSAQIAPLQLAIPPRDYGGTERVVSNVTEALVQLGHDVTLFASGDSRTSARLVPARERALIEGQVTDPTAYHLAHLADAYRRAGEFDVIHSHLEHLTLPFAATCPTPTVLTLHGRLNVPEKLAVLRRYPAANYISISDSQRAPAPELRWLATIHHGVDVEAFPFSPEPGGYLAFVGRISPEKGPDRAMRVAKRVGVPPKIAAKVDPADRRYFERVIVPEPEHPLIEFLGPLDERRKRELLVGALALLMPIDWPEPFGMAFIEALACGTPVLTRPRGAAPEVLRDGVTGYLREDDDGLVAAVGRVAGVCRAGCREYVRRRFTVRRMALEYVNAYARALGEPAPFHGTDVRADPEDLAAPAPAH